MSAGADDLWHVRIAPDEVKVLTLEQVDDLYRLEMIDENTLLWQDGMEPLPLRVVAGLDDDDEPKAAPAPPLHRTTLMPGWTNAPSPAPPPPPAPLPAPSRSLPPPPPPPFSAPPTRSAPPPPSAPRPPSAPPPLSASPAVFPGAAPLPVLVSSPAMRANRLEAVLIALAALLGLLVTLHRNGALPANANAPLDTAFGGPGFGTPRAVDALVKKTPQPPSDLPKR